MDKRVGPCLALCLGIGLALAGCGSASEPSPAAPTAIPGGAGLAPTSTAQPATDAMPSGAGNCANPLFPVVRDASWAYVVTGGPSGPVTYTSTVHSVDDAGFGLVQVVGSVTVTQHWSCADSGLVALDFSGPAASLVAGGTQASLTTVSQTGVTLPKSIAPGDSWAQTFQVEGTQTLPDGTTGKTKGMASYQSNAIGFEDVTVGAGAFHAMRVDGVMSLDLSVEMNGISAPVNLSANVTNWYAPGVGLVKTTQIGTMMGIPLNIENGLTDYSIP